MKKILPFLFLPMFSLAQLTYVPDDVFEEFIETTMPNASNGTVNDNYVITSALNIFNLNLTPSNLSGPIFDLTGIEDFNLSILSIDDLAILSIDLSEVNFVTGQNLNIHNNQYLIDITLPSDTLVGISIFNNEILNTILFQENLFFSNLDIWFNQSLCELIVKGSITGGNVAIQYLENLTQVDFSGVTDAPYQSQIAINGCDNLSQVNLNNNVSIYNWLPSFGTSTPLVDVNQPSYCETSNDWPDNVTYCSNCYTPIDCNVATSTQEISKEEKSKSLINIIDVLGRKAPPSNQKPLFYIYDDGTVEKRIIIE